MHPIDRLEPRNYAMLVASTAPIGETAAPTARDVAMRRRFG